MQFIAVYLTPEASSLVTGDLSSGLFAKLYIDRVAKENRGGGRMDVSNLRLSTAEVQRVLIGYL